MPLFTGNKLGFGKDVVDLLPPPPVPLYVEDVFNTDLYDGVDSPSAITVDNGIDLNGEGGMVWFARRSHAQWYGMYDTERGTEKVIYSDQDSAEGTNTGSLTAFNDDGFTIGTHTHINDDDGFGTTTNHVAWTFRKAPGFFDVVKYTGDGAIQSINHNLGCKPGCVMVKNMDESATDWAVWHKSLNTNDTTVTECLKLNTDGGQDGGDWWGGTAPTSTQFSVGHVSAPKDDTNKDGIYYIAYLFADGAESDAQVFGDGEDEAIIECGTYEGDGASAGFFEEIGFEPQWLLLKDADTSGGTAPWILVDSARNWNVGNDQDGVAEVIHPNSASVASDSAGKLSPRATGIRIDGSSSWVNTSGKTFIYVAIRRGPMKTPTDATKVFAIDTYGGTAPTPPQYTAGFPVDMEFSARIDATPENRYHSARLLGQSYMRSNSTWARIAESGRVWDYMDGLGSGTGTLTNYQSWMFRRAPGFFDAVCYTGTGSAKTENHNLGGVPELMIVKSTSAVEHWAVYHKDMTDAGYYLRLSDNPGEGTNSGMWNNTAPTASVFTVGADNETNNNTEVFIAYLFATCPGVSKVGSYDADAGSTIDIDCGFTAGARFVLIKRIDDSGNWMLYDTTRGIVSGNDPYIRLNSTQAQTTDEDHIDPHNPGFTVTTHADVNTAGGKYAYLAIA